MKRIYFFLITILLLLLNILPVRGQNTEGTEFWVTFGRIAATSYFSTEIQIRIVAGNQPTEVTLYFTNLGTSENFIVNAYEVYTYSLNLAQREAVYNLTMGTSNRSIYITTSKPVTIYALNSINDGSETTIVLPITALGTEYYQISYKENAYSDAYAVVATQNNTHLYHNGGLHPAAILNTGDVYYRTDTDMTGAHITSNYPVAFYATCRLTIIPYQNSLGGKHLMEQIPPVNTWGKKFFVPVTVMEQDIVRIVVSQDNTSITQTGGAIRTGVLGAQTTLTNLQAGEFVELDIFSNGCFIQADKPIGVCSYIKWFDFNGFRTNPAQAWIPEIGQTIFHARMCPFITSQMALNSVHYVLILTPTATKNNTKVSIGGAPPTDVSGGSWVENTIAGMSFYSMPLTNSAASYHFFNPQGLIIWGYSVTINSFQAYYYLAGSAMRDLDAAFYANNVHFQDLEENPFCENEIEFRAELDNMGIDADSIKWYINGVEYEPAQNHLEWNKIFPNGEYEIKMWVRFENNDTISKTGVLKIKTCGLNAEFYVNGVHYENLQNTTVCTEDVVIFRAEIEGLNPNPGSLKWYIDGGEEITARDKLVWSKPLPNGEYDIEMWVLFENDQETTIESTLKVEVFWIKIKNVKY